MTNDENPHPGPLPEYREREMREENLRKGEERLAELAAKRGLEWGKMTDEDRISFVDDLIHEDRGFPTGQESNG